MGKKEGRYCSGAFTPKRQRPSCSNLSGKLQSKSSRLDLLLASAKLQLPELPLRKPRCYLARYRPSGRVPTRPETCQEVYDDKACSVDLGGVLNGRDGLCPNLNHSVDNGAFGHGGRTRHGGHDHLRFRIDRGRPDRHWTRHRDRSGNDDEQLVGWEQRRTAGPWRTTDGRRRIRWGWRRRRTVNTPAQVP
jgi:hypothetical protein